MPTTVVGITITVTWICIIANFEVYKWLPPDEIHGGIETVLVVQLMSDNFLAKIPIPLSEKYMYI